MKRNLLTAALVLLVHALFFAALTHETSWRGAVIVPVVAVVNLESP